MFGERAFPLKDFFPPHAHGVRVGHVENASGSPFWLSFSHVSLFENASGGTCSGSVRVSVDAE